VVVVVVVVGVRGDSFPNDPLCHADCAVPEGQAEPHREGLPCEG
jgi:hypothetical protein